MPPSAFQRLVIWLRQQGFGFRLHGHTPLARQAIAEGVVSAEDDLLFPRFYIRPGLEDYIRQVQGDV